MPELPEVETIRRSLEPHLAGRVITQVLILGRHVVTGADPARFCAAVEGARIEGLGRRGKFLVIHLQDGLRVAVHLRMTGQLLYFAPGGTGEAPSFTPLGATSYNGGQGWGQRRLTPEERLALHTHARFGLDDGGLLLFNDIRKFGRLYLIEAGEAAPWAKMGPEPLSRAFTAAHLATALAGRRAPVKSLLLDQHVVAGVGNIYADEALFRARLHPATPAGELAAAQVARLHRAVRAVLREAVAGRGTTFSDYRDGLGAAGNFDAHLRVYGKQGEPCPRCGKALAKTVVAQRGTHFCPRCQRMG